MKTRMSRMSALVLLLGVFTAVSVIGRRGLFSARAEGQASTGSTYVVDRQHPNASDSNPGTEGEPWKTIQHAADVASPGDVILVKAGTYEERVWIKRSGLPQEKIEFLASPTRAVLMYGFTVQGSHIRLKGFRITTDVPSVTDKRGIFISGDGVEVVNNELFDIPSTAIATSHVQPYPTDGRVAGNRIYHVKMGITINGERWVVEGNEVERLVQYGSGDSDYTRFFGEDITFRNNLFHGSLPSEIGTAHVDCFQTFDNNGEYARNILIEGNLCFDFHQGLMATSNYYRHSSHITLQNNLFAHGWAWGIAVHNIPYIVAVNNTFADIRHHGIGIRDASDNNLVVNNIFYHTGTSYWASDGASLSGDHNLIFGSRDPGVIGPHDLLGQDPQFSDPAQDDFSLQAISPAIDAGQARAEVQQDIRGVPRPQGAGHDIGAYEHVLDGTPTFADVPLDHWAYGYIEVLYQLGYVAGCSAEPLLYCPEDTMTRAESAVFIERGVHGAGYLPPDPAEQIFADVPLDAWFAKWAVGLWEDGYTAGCGTDPLIYCPLQEHTRAEGTVFFLRMLHGPDYLPPDPVGLFADVPLDFWGAGWVEAGYGAGLIPACETEPELRFCPEDPLDRAMAAYMMVQAKGLTPSMNPADVGHLVSVKDQGVEGENDR